MDDTDRPDESGNTKGSWKLWLWVILAFGILITAWTVLIIIAARNQPVIPEM